MRVNLTDEELFICRTLGVMRRSVAMKNVKDQQVGKDCVWSIDIDGVVAEYCVAKVLNVCVDLSVSPRKGGHDLISKGKTIDVKSTRHKNGRLLATLKKKDESCDVYILAIVDDEGADIVGWEYGNVLFNDGNKIDLGHGIGYGIQQDKLRKFR